jgi:hypothetical protein
MSWSVTELGFDGANMQVVRVTSNADWGDVVNVMTPTGTLQVYVSPKGRKTRIFWNHDELDKAVTS